MKNINTNLRQKLWFYLMIAVMIGIFYFSSQDGETSSNMSSRVAALLAFLHIDWLITPDMVHGISVSVRKWAHIYIYMVLGFTSSMWAGTFISRIWKQAGLAALISCLYSATDEFHQSFVPGRCGTWRDMIYDGSGWIIGILLSVLITAIVNRIRINRT